MAPGVACLAVGFGVVLGTASLVAADRQGYELAVIVDGRALSEYASGQKTYIEALKGRSFILRLRNPTPETVAVALSVDGLNVVDAKRTSAPDAAKWILRPGQVLDIPGWQISGQTARRFFFTETGESYAKWIGDTRNVGTIEAVFFREKRRPIVQIAPGEAGRPDESAAAAPEPRRRKAQAKDSDRFAATGAGERTSFPVQWVEFEEDPYPVARIALRYEYRHELFRLGVLSPREDLHARERGRGFEGEYAPDPGPER